MTIIYAAYEEGFEDGKISIFNMGSDKIALVKKIQQSFHAARVCIDLFDSYKMEILDTCNCLNKYPEHDTCNCVECELKDDETVQYLKANKLGNFKL